MNYPRSAAGLLCDHHAASIAPVDDTGAQLDLPMKMFQLAMQGRGHVKEDIPCQDKTAAREEFGTKCIALADGAGSARLSHQGATAVVETVTKLLCREFELFYDAKSPTEVTTAILNAIHVRLHEVANDHACALADLASTLLFAASNAGRYIIGQLGDGCIAFSREGELKLATMPDKGEFINQTCFITSSHSERYFRLFKGESGSIDGFFLMSDGAAESLYKRHTDTVAPLVRKLIIATFCKNSEWLQDRVRDIFTKEIVRKTTDDCSIAVLPLFTSYRDLFDRLDQHDIFRLFYKAKYIHKQYTDDYLNILLHISQTDDTTILSKLTGIKMHTLKRRLLHLRKCGFSNIYKFL